MRDHATPRSHLLRPHELPLLAYPTVRAMTPLGQKIEAILLWTALVNLVVEAHQDVARLRTDLVPRSDRASRVLAEEVGRLTMTTTSIAFEYSSTRSSIDPPPARVRAHRSALSPIGASAHCRSPSCGLPVIVVGKRMITAVPGFTLLGKPCAGILNHSGGPKPLGSVAFSSSSSRGQEHPPQPPLRLLPRARQRGSSHPKRVFTYSTSARFFGVSVIGPCGTGGASSVGSASATGAMGRAPPGGSGRETFCAMGSSSAEEGAQPSKLRMNRRSATREGNDEMEEEDDRQTPIVHPVVPHAGRWLLGPPLLLLGVSRRSLDGQSAGITTGHSNTLQNPIEVHRHVVLPISDIERDVPEVHVRKREHRLLFHSGSFSVLTMFNTVVGAMRRARACTLRMNCAKRLRRRR